MLPDELGAELFVNADEDGRPGELMHESYPQMPEHNRYDEYFVPIPIKCLGEPRSAFWRQTVTSAPAQERFAAILADYDQRFPSGAHDERAAKSEVGEFFGDAKMNLVEDIGYYELLRRATDQTGAQNVLVGYSQGGTVARHLAFLDEQLASPGSRCIHGIITIDAPNRGSPLASPLKGPDIATAAMAIVLSFLQWLPEPLPTQGSAIWAFLREAGARAGLVRFMNDLLDAELRNVGPSDKRFPIWRSARKWLSGLSGIPDLAFWDLDPRRLEERGSVLHSINEYPLESAFHGAVVGSSNQLANFVELLLDAHGLLTHLAGALFRKKIEQLTAPPSALYSALVLDYPDLANPTASYRTLSENYLNGLPAGANRVDLPIPPRAHDFVVPTVSQLILDPHSSAYHLGNVVNPAASHQSGADGTGKVNGRSDEEIVAEMLRRM